MKADGSSDDQSPIERIVVFTGDMNYAVRKNISELLSQFPNTRILVMIERPAKPLRRLVRSQLWHLRRSGWRWLPYQARSVFDRIASRRQRTHWHSESRPGEHYSEDSIQESGRAEVHVSQDIHSDASLARVRGFQPDLGISLAAPILQEVLFGIPRHGTINLHKGKVPDYRGMPPAFWELWNDEQAVGCTVHRVTRGLDTGDVLLRKMVPRHPFSGLRGLQLTLDEVGVRLVCEAVRVIAQGRAKWTRQPEGGRTYRRPTIAQEVELARRLASVRVDPILRYVLKEALFWSCLRFYCPTRRLLHSLRRHRDVVVLLYHRVSDELRDSLTVGVEQFDWQMECLASHYPIASVEDIVEGRLPERTGGRTIVAVSFDDGYSDNYENAVPVLERHQVPATFFVSTSMIGRTHGFQHDLTRLGRPLATMTWDQLQEMRDRGFGIGSHTVSHCNCAQIDDVVLRRELVESRDVLMSQLGLGRVIFSYPFGKRTDITPGALRVVSDVGYAACLSAYGGTNRGRIDLFNILRMGVDCNVTRLGFLATLEGIRGW